MMIRPATLAAIARGEVDLAFRRWDRPRVVVGTRMRTAVGVLEVTSVDQVAPSRITAAEARRAGEVSLVALRKALEARAERPVYRVGLRFGGEDPRAALRRSVPSADEIAEIRRRLDRLDKASSIGAWTAATLAAIDASPGVRAPDLAAAFGRDTPSFKRDVRKLKELGLTESLDIGYRLSPRGFAVVDDGGPARDRPAPPSGTSLPRIGAPASRALNAAGYTTLESLDGVAVAHLLALHGVGPIAIDRLRPALAAIGLAFAGE
ncbi:MAG: hypothetical protein IPJ14_19580 [Kineosporiaceae bacterium]|nr:hypothetical protein [Kineosporiaceae bacterium]